jgi:hypothetical protein
MSAQSTCQIFINYRPHIVESTTLSAKDLASLAGVPHDNVVVEVETTAGLKMLALDESLIITDGSRFLVTRQFIMGGME